MQATHPANQPGWQGMNGLKELHLHTVKGHMGQVGVHLDLSYMTLSTATLVSQFLETQLKSKCEIKKKNLSLISFEMQAMKYLTEHS